MESFTFSEKQELMQMANEQLSVENPLDDVL